MNSHPCGSLEDHAHVFFLRVYFSDTDAGGVVYHSRYLDMAEHARTECLHLLGISHQEYLEKYRTCFVVRSARIEYLKPALLDQTLKIRTQAKKLGRFAMELVQEIFHEGELLATADIKLGYICLTDGRPSPLPETWRTLLSDLVIPPSP